MARIGLLVLQVLLLWCSNIQSTSGKSVWLFKVLAEKISQEGKLNAGEAPFNVREATVNAEEATILAEETIVETEVETLEAADNTTFNVNVNLTASIAETDVKFLSVAIGSKYVNHWWDGLLTGSGYYTNIASALAPIDLRVGGTYADFLIFKPETSECQADEEGELAETGSEFDSGYSEQARAISKFGVTAKSWQIFNAFLAKAGWNLLFDLNLFFFTPEFLWNTTNAEQLLNFSTVKGIPIPYFQLGNEPNAFQGNFGFRVQPEKLAKDYEILKNLTQKYPLYAKSKLYGPDVANVFGADVSGSDNAHDYLKRFVQAGAYNVVDGYSLHHYYLNGRYAVLKQFISPSVMEGLGMSLRSSLRVANNSPRPLPILLTETACSFGGGAFGLSNAYVGGFLWLDKLGVSAQYNVARVFRQSFYGAHYALIGYDNVPRTDYYLSVIYKRLIEGPVFNVTTEPKHTHLRVYAHCARRGLYTPGALVVYYLNLLNTTINITLNQYPGADLDLYQLTPGTVNGLRSWKIKLNGELLQISHDMVPPMPPKPHKGVVNIEPLTYGFIVVPQANIQFCKDYYTRLDSQVNE